MKHLSPCAWRTFNRITALIMLALIIVTAIAISSPNIAMAQQSSVVVKNEFEGISQNSTDDPGNDPSDSSNLQNSSNSPNNDGNSNNSNHSQETPEGPFDPAMAPKTDDISDPAPFIAGLAVSIIFLRQSIFSRNKGGRRNDKMKH